LKNEWDSFFENDYLKLMQESESHLKGGSRIEGYTSIYSNNRLMQESESHLKGGSRIEGYTSIYSNNRLMQESRVGTIAPWTNDALVYPALPLHPFIRFP
jgi:hypothetical protein